MPHRFQSPDNKNSPVTIECASYLVHANLDGRKLVAGLEDLAWRMVVQQQLSSKLRKFFLKTLGCFKTITIGHRVTRDFFHHFYMRYIARVSIQHNLVTRL